MFKEITGLLSLRSEVSFYKMELYLFSLHLVYSFNINISISDANKTYLNYYKDTFKIFFTKWSHKIFLIF